MKLSNREKVLKFQENLNKYKGKTAYTDNTEKVMGEKKKSDKNGKDQKALVSVFYNF